MNETMDEPGRRVNHPASVDDASGRAEFRCGDPQITLEWLAVLSAKGLPHALSRDGSDWLITVAADRRLEAEREICDYEGDRDYFRRASRGRVASVGLETSPSAIAVCVSIFIFFIVTGPFNPHVPCFERGAFSSSDFFGGEWWRPVTALTLHSDLPHALGNVVFLALFAGSLTFAYGGGAAWFLILSTAALGNASAAFLHGPWPRLSIGASTAVFGALGILGATRFLETFSFRFLDRSWIPLLAAFAILAVTGAPPVADGGEPLGGTDVVAHVTGFAWGLIVAAAAALLHLRRFRNVRGAQFALGLGAAAGVVGCWVAAMRA